MKLFTAICAQRYMCRYLFIGQVNLAINGYSEGLHVHRDTCAGISSLVKLSWQSVDILKGCLTLGKCKPEFGMSSRLGSCICRTPYRQNVKHNL